MTARLTSAILVSTLIRRAEQSGGSAMVLAKGDATAGGILLLTLERGINPCFFERGLGPTGCPALIGAGPAKLTGDADATAYWQRRRSSDPDLWVLEVDIAEAERFAAEAMGLG
ncbi:MAG: DUF1491 family protein [Sphingomonadales bacterium]|nr:MAG: DUF1491 family protein [Sphingomonadales bacterium]